MALRFQSTDVSMALIYTQISCDLNLQTVIWRCLSILHMYIRNSCLLFFSTISGLLFHSKNFNLILNRISLEKFWEVIWISGLPFSFRKLQFDSKSNFVEQNLERLEISGLLISFTMFQFVSKLNSVEESLKEFLACLFHSECFNLILNRISLEKFWEVIWISGLPFSFRKLQFDSKSNFVEQNLERLEISGLLISFTMFQFVSKSNFVEESLQRYRNFFGTDFNLINLVVTKW